MPKIDTYNGPRVQQRGASGQTFTANATAQQFGAGAGQAVSQIGQAINQNAIKMKAEDDMTVVKTALNSFRKQLNERTYLDDDAYFNRKGIDAYDSFDSSFEEFEKMRQETGKDLSERQQKLFNQTAQDYINNEHEPMSRYASAERNNWRNGQDNAVILQAQADGSLRYMDNGKFADQINATLTTMGKRNGWSKEELEQKSEGMVSTMHVQALDNLFVKQPSIAKDYYEAHKDAISKDLYDDIETKIKTTDDSVWVEEQAASIRVGGQSRSERLQAVNDLTDDPDRRKALRTQVQHDLTQENMASQEESVTAYSEAFDSIIDPTGRGMSVVEFATANPDQWEAMTEGQKRTILSDAKSPANVRVTDLPSYYELTGIIASDDYESAREYLLNNSELFSHADFKSFTDKVYASPKSGDSGPKSPLNAEAKAQFSDWVEGIIGKEPTKGDKREEYNRKRSTLQGMYVNSLTEESTYDDRRRSLDKLTEEVLIQEPKWWKHKSFEGKEVALHDLPEERLNELQSGFDSVGLPMTADDMRLAIELGVNLNDVKYTEIVETLRKYNSTVSLGKILTMAGDI